MAEYMHSACQKEARPGVIRPVRFWLSENWFRLRPLILIVFVKMMNIPSSEMIMRWLQQARIEHYVCDQCHGIHMVSLQSVEGIQESRIFVEEEGLLFSSELEVRPSSLLPLVAELGRLNMQYPSLKVFLDIIDDNLPRLVVGHTVFTKAGLTVEQFLLFVESTTAATHEVVSECERLGFLNLPEIQVAPESVH